MNRLRLIVLGAMCCIVPTSSVWSAPVPSGRSGLEQVPASAPIVIHLRGVQGVRDHFVAMMENALPDVLKKFQAEMDDFLKNGKDGRKLAGLVKDGPIFLALTDLPKPGQPLNGPPPFAFIVAVTNYKEFRDGLLNEEERKGLKDNGNGIEVATLERETTYFVNRKGYAIITLQEEVAKTFTKKFTGLKLSQELTAKLLGSDFGVYVNMNTINKDYGEEIKQAKKFIEEQVLAPQAGGGDESQKQIFEMIKKSIGPIFQAVEDMQGVLLTVEFRTGGLALHLQSEMKENSTTANLLQDSRPAAFKELANLPAGRAYYSAFKTSSALYKGLGPLIAGIPLGMGVEEHKDFAAALEELAKAGPTIRLDGIAFPMSGLQVYHYDDPAKAVAALSKLYKALAASDPKRVGLRAKPVLKMNAEKFGDFKLHSAQLAWDFEKMAEPAAQRGDAAKKQYIEALKKMLGDKMTYWYGTDGQSVVQVVAEDWPAARKLLDQYTKGTATVGESKAFREARKEMPARTSLLSLIDAVRMFGTIMDIAKPMLPPFGGRVPPGWPNIPDKAPVGFVGMSVTLQPRRGSLDLFITASAAREFYKIVVAPLVGE